MDAFFLLVRLAALLEFGAWKYPHRGHPHHPCCRHADHIIVLRRLKFEKSRIAIVQFA